MLNTMMTPDGPARIFHQRWFSLRQAAIYTGRSVSSLRRFVKAGRLRAASKAVGVMIFDVAELDRFMMGQ